MIVEERMRTYINSLDMGNTPFLEELEKEADKEIEKNKKESDSNVTEITYWAMSTQQDDYETVVEAFNKENKDIKVNISYHDTDGIKAVKG